MTTTSGAERLRSADLWTAVLVVLVGGVGLKASLDIFVPRGLNDFLGPRAFPITVSVLLIVAGVVLAVRTLLRGRSGTADLGSMRLLGTVLGVTAVYLVLFSVLGFLLATCVFLLALFVYLGEHRPWLALTVAVAVSVGISVAFGSGLDVALPTGPLGF